MLNLIDKNSIKKIPKENVRQKLVNNKIIGSISHNLLLTGALTLNLSLGHTLFAQNPEQIQEPASPDTAVRMVENPNFLFISVDDMKPIIGAMSEEPGNFLQWIYKDPQKRAEMRNKLTPHINDLANNGILFSNNFCSSAVCNPSRTALFTGIHTKDSNHYLNGDGFFRKSNNPQLKNAITLPQNLKANNYLTYGFGKIYHGTNVKGGIDWPDTAYSWTKWINRPKGIIDKNIRKSPWCPNLADPHFKFGIINGNLSQQHDYINADNAYKLLKNGTASIQDTNTNKQVTINLKQNQPFFLAVGIYAPHNPWLVLPDMLNQFPASDLDITKDTIQEVMDDLKDLPPISAKQSGIGGETDGSSYQIRDLWKHGLNYGNKNNMANGDAVAWKELIRHYLAHLKFADTCVGRIMEGLNVNEEFKNKTIVILWSDHGYHLGEKRDVQKNSIWEETAKAAMIVNIPWQTGSKIVRTQTSLMDLYPTVCDYANVPLPTKNMAGNNIKIYGNSLRPLIDNPDIPWDFPVITSRKTQRLSPRVIGHSLRLSNHRYIKFDNKNSETEIYDELNDPFEYINLAQKNDYSHLKSELNAVLANTLNNKNLFQSPFLTMASIPGKIEAEEYDKLQIDNQEYDGMSITYYDKSVLNNAGNFRNEGVDIEFANDNDGQYCLTEMEKNEWLEYSVDVVQGKYDLCLRVASLAGSGKIQALLDGNEMAEFAINSTGGAYNWVTIKKPVTVTGSSNSILRLNILEGGFKLNWLEFVYDSNINYPPIVNAGQDQTITLPANSVNLAGTVTDDGLPNNTLTTVWTQESGPGTVIFTDATAVDTVASFSGPGSYRLNLTADDSEFSTSDVVTITVNPAGDDDDDDDDDNNDDNDDDNNDDNDDDYAQNAVRLCSKANYKGKKALFTVGSYNQAAMVAAGMKNNDAHSIKILPDYKATLFTGGNFDGISKEFNSDSPRLGNGFNNQISSLIVVYTGGNDDDDDDDNDDDNNNDDNDNNDNDDHPANAVTLWPDANYKGIMAPFTVGSYNQAAMTAAGMNNNDAHSIKVIPGYEATIYTGGNFDGSSKVFTANSPRLGGNFSNQVSSVKIRYIGD